MGLSLRPLGRKISDIASGVERQIDPLDAGLSYKTRVAAPQQQQQSVVQQATNNFVRPVVHPFSTIGSAIIHTPQAISREIQNKPIYDIQQHVFGTTNPTSIGKQIVGDLGQIGLTVAAPGVSKGIEAGASRLLPAAAPKVVQTTLPKVISNSQIAGGFNALNAASQGANIKQTAKAYGQGTAVGSAFPVAGAAAKPVVRVAAKEVKAAANPIPRTTLNDQRTLAEYSDHISGAKPLTPGQLNHTVAKVREIAQKHGKLEQVVKGSPLDRLNGVNDLLDTVVQRGKTQSQIGARAVSREGNVSENHTALPKVSLRQPEFSAKDYVKQQTEAQKLAAEGSTPPKTASLKQSFRVKAVDALAPIEDPVNAAVGRSAALPLRNALDRSLRSRTIAGAFAEDNGLHNIIKSVPDTKAFDQYVIAKHAQDLEANGIKTGRNLAKDRQLVEALAPKYEAHAQALTDYNQKLLDTAANYGLISKDTAAYLKQKYPNYVPMNRVFTDAELQQAKGVGSGPASLSTQTVVQRINGSAREVQSPLESVLAKTHDVVAQGERNTAAKVLSTYKDLPNNPLGLRELDPGETIGTKPTISFFDNGIQKTFETTPEVAAAAKSLNKEQLGFVGQIFAVPTRVLRLGATSANAAFALANVAKDSASGFINSEHSLRSSVANPEVFVKAMAAAANHGSASYRELVREGAGGTSFDIARNAAKDTLGKVRSQRNVGTKALYTVRHPGELMRAVEDTIGRSEEFNRALQYYGNKQAALKEGKSAATARAYGADAARNNTVNFARAGEYGRTLNSVLPYLNAGVQGSRTLLRNLKERPAQTTTKLVIAGFIPVATATAWNLNDPERKKAYDNISEYEKQNNIIIVPPHPKQDAEGRWNVIKIPVSQEIANLNNIVRNGVEALHQDKNFNFSELAGNLTGTATSLNVQNPRQFVGQATPQAVKPVVETALNQNLFTGQQIVPDALKNLAPQDQVSKSTSGTARVLGRITGRSPLQIDNAIRTTTGGLGQNVIHQTDTALAKAGLITPDQIKGKSLPTSIANRFNSAQGQTPGSLYFSTLQDTAKQQKLAGKDYELLNALTTKTMDASGNAIPQDDKSALNNNQILANNPRVAAVKAAAAISLAKKTGKPVDPLYTLTPEQQTAYYKMQGSIYKGQAYERIAKENQDWLPAFQKERTAYYDNLHTPDTVTSNKIKYPLNSSEQTLLNQYFAITDPTKRAAMSNSNPAISDAFNKLSKYANDKQIAQGSAPLDTYPQSSPQVQQWTKEYFAQPKGSKMKWQRANPGKWQAVSQQLTSQSLYGLENDAVAAQYKDTGLSQKGLADLYNLGQYDVQKGTDANGNTFYALGSSGGSGGGYGKYASGGSSKTPLPYEKALSLNAGGKIAQPKVSVKLASAYKSSKGKAGKPKVTLKKSKV